MKSPSPRVTAHPEPAGPSSRAARRAGLLAAVAFVATALVAAHCGSSGAKDTTDAGAGSDGTTIPLDGAGGDDAAQGDDGGTSGEGGSIVAGQDATVDVFDSAPVYFGPTVNQRTVDKTVTFPTDGAYEKITLHLALTCPAKGCDIWDRFGSLVVVQPTGPTNDAGSTPERLIEVARFVTPFGMPASKNPQPSWDFDVTELRPLLSGTVTLRAFIDTWVPQNVANQGYGWQVTASVEMKGGVPAKVPVAVVPIWSWQTTNKEPTEVVYGDPSVPIATSLPPQSLQLPAGATSYGVRSFITGHGQANLDNCAEFCSRKHTWTVGSTANAKTMWRTDCASYPSGGTNSYTFPRGGWCPGTAVDVWDFDVTSQVATSGPTLFGYGVDAYVNTCNGTADGGGPCQGCPAGVSCPYDGSAHTQPFYYVSASLIGYR